MSDQPDYSQAGDVFRQSMEESLAHLDALQANLMVEHNKAIDLQNAAKDERNRILNEADKISEERIEERRKIYFEQIRKEIYAETVTKLIAAEIPSDRLRRILKIPAQVIADIWFHMGFEKIDDQHIGHVAYEQDGRSGYVVFLRNDLTARFYFEFAGGDMLAVISIPAEDQWEQQTGIPLADRKTVLEFVAGRVVRDQAPKGKYFIGEKDILISESE